MKLALTPDQTFHAMVGGFHPAALSDGGGTLDAFGDASAALHAHPSLAPLVGRRLWLAAVTYTTGPLQVRRASTSVVIDILP